MNKRKIIFIIILVCILIGVFALIFISKQNQQRYVTSTKKGDLKVWIVGDDKDKFGDFVSVFKKENKNYSSVQIDVESFPNYEEYINSLALSFVVGNYPDIFVLNNNEKSIFLEKVKLITSETIKSNDFRKKFKGVFSDDLITTTGTGQDIKEALYGVPVGYETLGIFYNITYLRSKNLKNWDSLKSSISQVKNDHPGFVPIGIGKGSSVYEVSDIITSFLVGKNIFDIDTLGTGATIDTVKNAIGSYLLYGDINDYNSYNSKFEQLKSTGENNLDLFSKGDVLSVIGYPRMIEKIDEKGYKPNLLLADPFPLFGIEGEKTLINYNYFVINKDSKNSKLANSLLKYMLSEKGAREYLNIHKYYLPSMLSLESEKLEENIYEGYNIKLGDFFDKNRSYTSFNKGNKAIYDKEIVSILDDELKYFELFERFRASLLCRVKKFKDFENLGEDCYKQ